MSFSEFSDLRRVLPGFEFVDAGKILQSLRAAKSKQEVSYLRKAAEITSSAMAETFAAARPSMTERDVMRLLRIRLAELGGENVTFMWVVSSGSGMVATATDRSLKVGGVLVLDAGVEYRGYCSDVARTASVGEPTEELSAFYRWMLDIRAECVDLLRVGRSPEAVLALCNARIKEKGIATLQANRIGHGVGLESTEFPSLGWGEGIAWPGDREVSFEEGMVLACNPSFTTEYGWMNIEDEWEITAQEPRLLSQPAPPKEIPVIG